ncbi:MAG: 3' terminal RNA ribose 2'-O-methyltransferase Hen1 [Lachnospiraceae bacterium]|nr:3' terminal RNA ribose 2'-O-methyltransferase Hen1 [Lachnospiraceae bacterium]
MLLTITYRGENTQDLGYLLYKNPARPQSVQLSMGRAYIFYPEVSDEETTVALLVSLDPLNLAKGKTGSLEKGLFAYVNDRPYVASSFMTNAINRVFGTAMTGRCDSRPELAASELDLEAKIYMLPVRGNKNFLNEVFEPLGYEVKYETFCVDEEYPGWGECDCVNLMLHGKVRVADLLNQLYILIPVFDLQRHYFVNDTDVEAIVKHGENWLPSHPLAERIVRRYFKMARSLGREASERLGISVAIVDDGDASQDGNGAFIPLDQARLEAVLDEILRCGAKTCIDLGCGEGKLIKLLLDSGKPETIAGADVVTGELKKAAERIGYERLPERQKQKVKLFQGSLMYPDERFKGYDCMSVIEVMEHIEPERLPMLEQVVFKWAAPKMVIFTTPDRRYNENYGLYDGQMRHDDHRFEWDREEFEKWTGHICEKYGYTVTVKGIDVNHNEPGDGEQERASFIFTTDGSSPTQMAVFVKK